MEGEFPRFGVGELAQKFMHRDAEGLRSEHVLVGGLGPRPVNGVVFHGSKEVTALVGTHRNLTETRPGSSRFWRLLQNFLVPSGRLLRACLDVFFELEVRKPKVDAPR